MATNGVQSGLNRVQFSDLDISKGLLAVGVGVLSYEIVSKAVHKIAGDAFSKIWLLSLVASTVVMISAATKKLPDLQGRFVALFVVYVVVSIVTRKPEKIKESSLPKYMVDMVDDARKGAYFLKIGYEKPLDTVEVYMNKKTIANAVLLAPPGIGKSTIAETIAWKIANGKYSPRSVFFNAKLIQVDVTALIAGTTYRGSLEERVQEMIDLAKKDPKIIYWIDEIHMLVGGGETINSHVDVSKMLMTAMARGDIRILSASTIENYNRYIKPKLDFARRLPQVIMEEPTPAECFKMLRHSYDLSTAKERIKISSLAIEAAIFFFRDAREQYFPGKAIKLIEEAESSAKLTLDKTENEVVLTEYHIAKALCLSSPGVNFDGLIQHFRQFMNEHPDYFSEFPGVAPL